MPNIRPRNLIYRIANDLRTGALPFPASEDRVRNKYARYPGDLPWREYREAVRLVGATDGTLVVVDDENECFVAATDFDGECTEATVLIFTSTTITRYRSTVNLGAFPDGVRLTLYRLPRGAYATRPHSFFFDHAEYLGERRLRELKSTAP